MFVLTSIYFSPELRFILVYNCGLTVSNKRICYVIVKNAFTRASTLRMHVHTQTDGKPKNIMPPVPSVGWGSYRALLHSLYLTVSSVTKICL